MIALRGRKRTVDADDLENPVVLETYNLSEAAEALGKTQLTLRRWIETDILPGPYLTEKGGHGVKVYSRGELETIVKVLNKHRADYQYLCARHEHVKHDMHQHIQAYRAHNL